MLGISQTILLVIIIILLGFTVYSLFNKKGLTTFLYGFFTLTFWGSILFFMLNISLQLLTNNGIITTSEKGKIHIAHYTKGYAVPVDLNIMFQPKKIFTYLDKETGTTSRFTKFSDQNLNEIYDDSWLKSMGITKKELDSIFQFSDVKEIGKKLHIGINSKKNSFLSTNTSAFKVKSYINIKSENLFFTLCQFIGTYLIFIILILIFYNLKSIFKMLNTEIAFSLKLTNKIKQVGILLIVWQLLKLILSIVFSFYYSYVSFENSNYLDDIQLKITPNFDIDFVFILIGLGLLMLSLLLKKGNTIQQENDLTI